MVATGKKGQRAFLGGLVQFVPAVHGRDWGPRGQISLCGHSASVGRRHLPSLPQGTTEPDFCRLGSPSLSESHSCSLLSSAARSPPLQRDMFMARSWRAKMSRCGPLACHHCRKLRPLIAPAAPPRWCATAAAAGAWALLPWRNHRHQSKKLLFHRSFQLFWLLKGVP